MANLFGPGGLLGPAAPGVSGAVNPLAMLGLGIYQGNPADALTNMGNLQQAGAELQLQQQMHQNTLQQQERERRRRQALASAMSGAYAGQPTMQAIAQSAPGIMAQHYLSGLTTGPAAPGLLTREELGKEYDLSAFTPQSVLDVMAKGATAGGYDPTGLVKQTPSYGLPEETGLRKEFNAYTKTQRAGLDKANQVQRSLSMKGPISDVGTVYAFIGALDPASVVRESETDLIAKAGGVINQLKALRRQAEGEGIITDAVREEMRQYVGMLQDVYAEGLERDRQKYMGIAGAYGGIRPDVVVGEVPGVYRAPTLNQRTTEHKVETSPIDDIQAEAQARIDALRQRRALGYSGRR